MNLESIYPFLLIIAPFALAFFGEAVVIYFFKVKRFWAALGLSALINVLTLAVLYGSSLLLGKLGYEFNGLQLPLQVVVFLWWLSILADGSLLRVLAKGAQASTVFLCAIVMNTLSYLFLYFFIVNSH